MSADHERAGFVHTASRTEKCMRRAVITIEWVGPDKPVREVIEDSLDTLFESLLVDVPKVGWATTHITFQPKAKS